MNRVEDLEAAILKRAEKLATEYRERAERRRASIVKEAGEQLRLREEHETALAKAQGDLVYLRKVQASELRLKAHMDHLRWGLVQGMEHRLKDRMAALADEQEDAYLQTLQKYLAQGAQAIERGELIVEVNHRDHQRLMGRWDSFVAAAAPGKTVTLADKPIDTVGGMLIRSQDGNIRLDNTFEGRRERLRSKLHQIIVERLIPATVDGGGML
jgi:V/A-type H+-transporting ATPase subunit E